MPHWQSEPDAWKQVCSEAGIGFIDPRDRPDDVLGALGRTDVLIAEAMHGAIVADALRIPWIPVCTRDAIKSFKWEDWCGSLALDYRPDRLPTIWPEAPGAGFLGRTRRRAKLSLAARALGGVARRGRPLLSREEVLDDRLRRLEDRLDQLRITELAA
jgi:succinoglycan biosynthesis protein ExoV